MRELLTFAQDSGQCARIVCSANHAGALEARRMVDFRQSTEAKYARAAAHGRSDPVPFVTAMDNRTIVSASRFGRQAGLNMLGTLQKSFAPESLILKLISARNVMRQLTGDYLDTTIDDSSVAVHFQALVRRLRRQSWYADSLEVLPRRRYPVHGLVTQARSVPLVGSEQRWLTDRLAGFVFGRGVKLLQSWQREGLHVGLRANEYA